MTWMRAARVICLGATIVALGAPQASAAPDKHSYAPPTTPATIVVVRSSDPDCAGRCSDWISIEGAIGPGTARAFAATLQRVGSRRLPVLINSPGGLISEAVQIGHQIRSRGLDVGVSHTVLTDCVSNRELCAKTPSGIKTGSPATTIAICASACSFILASGTRRFVPFRSFVGVHQFRTFQTMVRMMRTFRVMTRKINGETVEVSRTLISEHPTSRTRVPVNTPQSRYSDAQRFFETMGISPKLMELAEQTAPDAIHWLSLAELVSTKMDTEGKDGAFMIAHAGDASGASAGAAHPPPSATSPARSSAPAPDGVASSEPSTRPTPVEDATLRADGSEDRDGLRVDGWVTWSIDQKQASPALVGVAELSDGAGEVQVRIEDHGLLPGRPDYNISLLLRPGRDSPFRMPLAAMLPGVVVASNQPPVELKCSARTLSPGVYDFDLSTGGQDAETDRMVMKRAVAFDFGLIVYPIRTLHLTLARGLSGAAAFRRWRELIDAHLLAG